MPDSGVLLVAKPAGVTSHDVVAAERRKLPRGVKVGHAGTLDPFATGLLLVLIGSATRAQQFLMQLPKTYRAVARLGWTSDTGDRDGVLTETGRVPAELELPVGEMLQRPPAYSAVKVGGERLYKKARRGEAMEGEPRPVTVHRFEQLWREGDRAGLELEVSSGTYVRQLVADLGDAYCEELERTAVGPFSLMDAGGFVPLGEALGLFMEGVELDDEAAARARNGVAIRGAQGTGDRGQDAVRLTNQGRLVAVARIEDDHLKPFVVFPDVGP
jgi:tRNA pseudouridine55 synthase